MYNINIGLMEKIKLIEEKNKIFINNVNSKIKLKYPHILDQQFQKKIALKKEFQFPTNLTSPQSYTDYTEALLIKTLKKMYKG